MYLSKTYPSFLINKVNSDSRKDLTTNVSIDEVDSFNMFMGFCFPEFMKTCDYSPGDSFGDLALMTHGK